MTDKNKSRKFLHRNDDELGVVCIDEFCEHNAKNKLHRHNEDERIFTKVSSSPEWLKNYGYRQ